MQGIDASFQVANYKGLNFPSGIFILIFSGAGVFGNNLVLF